MKQFWITILEFFDKLFGKKSYHVCSPDEESVPPVDMPALIEEFKRMKRTTPPVVTAMVLFDYDSWIPRYKSLEGIVAKFKPMLDSIAARDLNDGVVTKWKFALSKPGEFKTSTVNGTAIAALRRLYPRFPADKIVLVKDAVREVNSQGSAIIRGTGNTGFNFANVFITDDVTIGGRMEEVFRHEVCGHLDGLPHSHDYVHLLDGRTNQAIDNFGQRYFPSTSGKMSAEDALNPKLTPPGSGMSYASSARQPSTPEFHPLHKTMRLAFLNSMAPMLGKWNTAYDFKWNDDGTLTYSNDSDGDFEFRIGKYAPGATQFTDWKEFPKKVGNETFTDFEVSTYVSSGTTGFRHYSGAVDLSLFDVITVNLPTGWLYSFGVENKSLSGALTVPDNGVIVLPRGQKINYINFRPKTVTTVTPANVTATKQGQVEKGGVLKLPALAPNTWYFAEMRVVGSTVNVLRAWFQTPAVSWDGTLLTDSGGASGKHENDQECDLPTIPQPPTGYAWDLECTEFDLYDPVDYLMVNDVKYTQNNKFPAKKRYTTEIRRKWYANGDGTGKGYKMTPRLVKL